MAFSIHGLRGFHGVFRIFGLEFLEPQITPISQIFWMNREGAKNAKNFFCP
jgi:hypothetical protein